MKPSKKRGKIRTLQKYIMRHILENYSRNPFTKGEHELSELMLRSGEVWLSTEPQKLSWLEAIEIAGMYSNIRLPHYSDLIRANKNCQRDENLFKEFPPLEEGEFWTLGSEGYKAHSTNACCLIETHDRYESNHLKFEEKWVRFIKHGNPESIEQKEKKDNERKNNIYEENLSKKSAKILGLDTTEGQERLRIHEMLMNM